MENQAPSSQQLAALTGERGACVPSLLAQQPSPRESLAHGLRHQAAAFRPSRRPISSGIGSIATILFFVFFSVLLFCAPARADELDILKEIPKFVHNIRPFDTIAFSYLEEKSDDYGRTWRKVGHRSILWDRKTNSYMAVRTTSEYGVPGQLPFEKFSIQNGKKTEFFGTQPYSEDFPLHPKELIDRGASITNAKPEILLDCPYLAFFCYDFGRRRVIWDVFSDTEIFKTIQIMPGRSRDTAIIDFGDSNVFEIYKETGLIKKNIDIAYQEDGTTRDSITEEVKEYISKDGWFFPAQFVMYYDFSGDRTAPKDANKYMRRYTLDKKSLEINRKYYPSDFAIEIPDGCFVKDKIQNRTYRASGKLKTIDTNGIEKQLLQLLDKPEKP